MRAPYRNDLEALQQRRASLEAEIARLRAQTTGLDELRARESDIGRELAAVESRLAAGGAARRALPLLDQVRVASPCNADWNEMLGDERVRFCLGCEKNVYNLSALPREDAEALLQARLGGEMCVRFYERKDGTILTQDCPVGVKKKQRRKLALAVAGAGVMAAATASAIFRTTQGTPQMGQQALIDPPYAPTPTTTTTAEVVPVVPPDPTIRAVMGERPMMMGVVAPLKEKPQALPKAKIPKDRR